MDAFYFCSGSSPKSVKVNGVISLKLWHGKLSQQVGWRHERYFLGLRFCLFAKEFYCWISVGTEFKPWNTCKKYGPFR